MLIVSDRVVTGPTETERQEQEGLVANGILGLFSLAILIHLQVVSATTEIIILEVDDSVSGNVCRC